MKRTLLKSKIHRATVTDADLDYEGSISIDPLLARAADLVPFERVEIYNIDNGERFATYFIEGREGSGEITLNGAAAHKVTPGDLVIICSYAEYTKEEIEGHKPRLVYVDAQNRILHTSAAVA
ncbi:MAG: aspartate 1-decarboxylase [Thermoanaerobaculia bacterium]